MIWLVLVLALCVILLFIRGEVLANRVHALETEVHKNLRPRSHEYATKIMRLEIKTGIVNGEKK